MSRLCIYGVHRIVMIEGVGLHIDSGVGRQPLIRSSLLLTSPYLSGGSIRTSSF